MKKLRPKSIIYGPTKNTRIGPCFLVGAHKANISESPSGLSCGAFAFFATGMNECLVAGVQDASVDVSYRLRCGGISCTPLRRLDWQKKTLDNNPKSIV